MHTSPYAQAAPCATETVDFVAISREHIEHWVVQSLAECAGLCPQDIDVTLPYTAYGLDSLTGVTLIGDLEVWLKVSLSPTLLWDVPSIDRLVQYLVDAIPVAPDDLESVNEFDQEWTTELWLNPQTARQLLPQLQHLPDQDIEAILCEIAA